MADSGDGVLDCKGDSLLSPLGGYRQAKKTLKSIKEQTLVYISAGATEWNRSTALRFLVLALMCIGAVATASGRVPRPIFIEAGDAEYTLTDLVFTYVAPAEATDFFYDPLQMRGFRTHAVRNAPDWQTALRQMLVGTGFEVDVTRLGVVMISKMPEVPPETTVAHAAGRNTHQRARASHSPTNTGTRPPGSIEPNCICGAQVDRQSAADWQHWCFVDGDVARLRWATTCEAVP